MIAICPVAICCRYSLEFDIVPMSTTTLLVFHGVIEHWHAKNCLTDLIQFSFTNFCKIFECTQFGFFFFDILEYFRTVKSRGSQEFKNYPGSIFFVKALATPPPPAFQTRYVSIQKWYVFPTLLLKKFLAVLLVGRKPFPAFKWI